MLRLSNTLSGKLEEFQTLEPKLVKMYSCGPTVYDYGHIGNFLTFLFVDLLRRFLKQSGYKLDHVMNITDVDDKIIRNAAQQKKTVREYAQKYEDAFLEDCKDSSFFEVAQSMDAVNLYRRALRRLNPERHLRFEPKKRDDEAGF